MQWLGVESAVSYPPLLLWTYTQLCTQIFPTLGSVGRVTVRSVAAIAQHFYPDTNAFRYFGIAFADNELAADLRARMLVSPLTTFEALAQLAREDCGEDVLKQIKAMRNWTDPSHTGLLPWPNDWLYTIWHNKPKPDDGFTKKIEDAFNWCMTADSADSLAELKQTAVEHAKLVDAFKLQKAIEFKAMIDAARQEGTKAFDTTQFWFNSIANSVGADPASKPEDEIVDALSAQHEFEQAKLQTALKTPEYNPLNRTNQNDIFDVEQLVYLADPSLYMITSDRGFKRKVKKSTQVDRIILASADDLMDGRRLRLC